MPLPWLMVYFSIFVCFYTISVFFSAHMFSTFVPKGVLRCSSVLLPW